MQIESPCCDCIVPSSDLDYGSIVYGCASASNLRTLDTVHHAGILLATGAFRTSRIDCLLVDAGEPSLSMRRDILLCSYSAKISGFPNHPTYRSLLHLQYKSSYVDRPSLPRPSGIRLVSLCRISISVFQNLFHIPVLQFHHGHFSIQCLTSALQPSRKLTLAHPFSS